MTGRNAVRRAGLCMVLDHDLIAGVTVAALIVPKNLGYAGIPLQNGLYAAAAGAIQALFGTCRRISMGPSSGLAAVAAIASRRPD